jgi:hypothetical protein
LHGSLKLIILQLRFKVCNIYYQSSSTQPASRTLELFLSNTIFFQDYHTVEHSAPVLDKSQDWTLLHGEENDFGTILKIARKLDTCDENDYKISVHFFLRLHCYITVFELNLTFQILWKIKISTDRSLLSSRNNNHYWSTPLKLGK